MGIKSRIQYRNFANNLTGSIRPVHWDYVKAVRLVKLNDYKLLFDI